MDRGGGIPWGLNPIKTCSRFGKGGEENSIAVAAENKNEISAVSEGVRKLKMPRSGSSREKSEGSCSAAASGLPPLRRVAKSGENRNEISALSDSVSKLKMPQCSGENSEGYLSVAGSGLPPLRKTAKAAENRNEIYALSESVSKLKMPRSSGGENSEDCLSAAAFGLPPLRKTAKSDGRKKDVSSFQSSYHGESSSKIVFETEELKVFNGNTDFCSNIDNKGPVSPQISGGQNLFKGQKSYSHELGPRGGMHPIYPRAHSDNDLKELVGVLHARFDVAKEEVNIELKDFAGELVDILEQNDVFSPECDEKVEDLLILARSCAMMSPTDFRSECEKVVQDLADRRQKMPAGYLKQLHTRMLFILTRCNRLLQFQKDSNWGHESSIHKFKQCLDGVPSVDINWKRRSSKKNKAGPVPNQFGKQDKDPTYIINKSIAETCSIDPMTLEDTMKRTNASFDNFGDALHDNQPNFASHVCSKSIESCNADSRNLLFKANHPNDKSDLDWNYHSRPPDLEKSLSLDTACKESSVSPVEEDSETVICRICEEMVPTSQLEPHSYLCACAERCDSNTFHVDERLLRMSEILEQVLERDTLNSAKTSIGSPEVSKMQSFSAMDGYESYSPKYNNEQYKVVEEMVEGLHEIDTVSMEDWKAPYLKSSSLLRFEQAFVPSSVGSLTPKSGMDSPKINQIDSFWLEHYNLTESEDFTQIAELAEIARCVANVSLNEYKATESLIACMQDLQNLFQKSKAQALVIDTIGHRVEKLLREKYLLACEMLDQKGFDSADEFHEEETALADDCSNRITSLLNPPQKDRITISDFELLKPISKGAFGKVFLARKLTTGDLFAIKVLRKMDMIRKNAVESILSERNILITVRNPFVVRFFYSFTCRDNLYLVMEFLNGGDLYSLLKNVGYLEEEVVRVYIAELVLALEYLHSLGIVHRDLKPDNILIAHDGHIKLTDFGLSKLGLINSTDDLAGAAACESACLEGTDTDISSEEFHYTQERIKRSAVGTPDYLAPEILLGTEHGYTADWWSTGIVLFELLTGIPPFTAEHPQKIFDNILSRKIPWPRVPEEMSNDAKDLIEKLLVEDPNQRLGAKGAFEVKRHPFFSTINWDTVATQKAAFVPSPESADDTSYFASRHSQNSVAFQHYPDSSNYTTSSMSSDSAEMDIGEGVDTCGDLTSFDDSSVNCSAFNNFSFKNLAQLASINYDLLSQSGKESSKSSSPSKSHDH